MIGRGEIRSVAINGAGVELISNSQSNHPPPQPPMAPPSPHGFRLLHQLPAIVRRSSIFTSSVGLTLFQTRRIQRLCRFRFIQGTLCFTSLSLQLRSIHHTFQQGCSPTSCAMNPPRSLHPPTTPHRTELRFKASWPLHPSNNNAAFWNRQNTSIPGRADLHNVWK
jgi:hypothetical protein